ncbi:hypothetical protein Tco_0420738 [Tanacetum coccineum]
MFIPNNSTVPKLQTAEDLQGDTLLHYDAEMELMNLILLQGDTLLHYDAEMELMNLILLSIPNDIYNYVDACTSAKDMWKRVERLMRGTIQNKVDRETLFTNEFDHFIAEPGEALVSETLQLFNATTAVEKDIMLGIVQSQEFETQNTSWEQMMEEIKELSTNICLMARIQPADNTSDDGPSYDSAFISEVQSSSNTENEEQMQMSENEDRYHDTVLDLEAKLKKNVDLILKLGNSLQGMFMLGPKLLSVYDQQLKPIGWGNSEISLAIRDSEDTLLMLPKNCWTIDYAQINALYKDFVPQKELSAEQKYFPSSFIPSDKNSNATPSIPASMPSESPLITKIDKIKNGFQKLSELIQKNCKRASIFYTSPEEIQLNDFCQDQLKPIVNELQFYFEFFKILFQRDVKEMKDVFESTESKLCEQDEANDFLMNKIKF